MEDNLYTEEKRAGKRWQHGFWRNKRATCHFQSLHVFCLLFLLLVFCNGVDVECFYACTPRTQQNRASPDRVALYFIPIHPSIRHSPLPIPPSLSTPFCSPPFKSSSRSTKNQINSMCAVQLHRRTPMDGCQQGVDRAVGQCQLLNDLLRVLTWALNTAACFQTTTQRNELTRTVTSLL